MVGMAVYSFLVVAFYTFLGLFLGNRIAEFTVTSIFSFVVISLRKFKCTLFLYQPEVKRFMISTKFLDVIFRHFQLYFYL